MLFLCYAQTLHPRGADSKLAQPLLRVRGSHFSHGGSDEYHKLWPTGGKDHIAGDNHCSKGYRVGGISVCFRKKTSAVLGLSSASHPGGFSFLLSHSDPCLFKGSLLNVVRGDSAPYGPWWRAPLTPFPLPLPTHKPEAWHSQLASNPDSICLARPINLGPWDGSATQGSNQSCKGVWNNPIEKEWVSNSVTTRWQQKLLPWKLRNI